MNRASLKCILEVEHTRSTTKAARNLFMGEPNLSKVVRELEKELGFTIFRRTKKGTEPTRKGAEFLDYARTVVSQIDEQEALYKPHKNERIRVSFSALRSLHVSLTATDFIETFGQDAHLDIRFRQTGTMQAIADVAVGDSDWGIIRYPDNCEKFFLSFLDDKKLTSAPVWKFNLQLALSNTHPLAEQQEIYFHMLDGYTEIADGEQEVPSLSFSQIRRTAGLDSHRRIFVYDLGSRWDLLQRVRGAYMWEAPVPRSFLTTQGVVMRPCPLSSVLNHDVLIWRKSDPLDEYGREFLSILNRYIDESR